MSDPGGATFRVIVKLRDMGVSVRVIARTFGIPKSTLHRWLPAMREMVLEDQSNSARVSHMGQEDQQKAAPQSHSSDLSVPYGTAPGR